VAILSTDIQFRLSGGSSNTNVDAALGGAMSSTAIVDATLQNLFDQVTGAESAAGDIEYRCMYVRNGHATLPLTTAKIWISTNTPASDTTVDIALGGEGDNGTAETVATESAAPVGETFSAPTSYATGLSLGSSFAAGHSYPVWVRWSITAGAVANASDNVIFSVQGDTAA
jgi:hypothetical protein